VITSRKWINTVEKFCSFISTALQQGKIEQTRFVYLKKYTFIYEIRDGYLTLIHTKFFFHCPNYLQAHDNNY